MADAGRQALAQAHLRVDEIHTVIAHQANLRIIQATQEALGLPSEKVFVNIHRYGNTGAASVPIALAECLETGHIQPGDNLLLVSFGGGLTWAATVMRWACVEPLTTRRRDAPPEIKHQSLETSFV
jgi:3-oxoacyl-[acyl-carrier-protein] synthase-3